MKKIDVKKMDREKIVGTYGRFDLVADHGKGAVCVDEEGKEYIDRGDRRELPGIL